MPTNQKPTITYTKALREYRNWLGRQKFTSKTIRNYTSDLSRFFAWKNEVTPGEFLTISDTDIPDYVLSLLEKATPTSTLNRKLASFRNFSLFLRHTWPALANFSIPTNPTTPEKTEVAREKITVRFYEALVRAGCKEITAQNYAADIRLFSDFYPLESLASLITKPKIAEYLKRQTKDLGWSRATRERKMVSFKRFAEWAVKEEYLEENPFVSPISRALANVSESFLPLALFERFSSVRQNTSPPQLSTPITSWQAWFQNLKRGYDQYTSWRVSGYLHLAILVIFAVTIALFGYQQFFVNITQQFAYPSSPLRPSRVLSFQGRITDSAGTPITTSINTAYRLYDNSTGGNLLWDSSTCAIDPDQDGIFSTLLGDSVNGCGSEIAESVFSQNQAVWLEVQVASETLTPRQRIATVPYSLNSETLQGFPPSLSGTINTIPVINALGQIIIGANNPSIIASSGAFLIQGESLTLQTESGSAGNINLAPDAGGTLNIQSGTTTQNSIYVTNANLTTGNLIAGYVGNNNTGYNLISLSTGSTPDTKFLVDALGNTTIDGYLRAPGATLSATYAGGVPLTIQGGPSGTGDLTSWQNSSGTPLASVDASGNLAVAGNIGILTDTDLLQLALNQLTLNGALNINGNISRTSNNLSLSTLTSGDLSLVSAGQLYFDDQRTGAIPFSLADTALNANLTQGIVDAINDVYNTASSNTGYWELASGALFPKNPSTDLLIGGTSTASAKFAFINVDSGTPVASIAGNIKLSGGARTIGGTAMNDLTIGDAQTGALAFAPAGTTRLTLTQAGYLGLGDTSPDAFADLQNAGEQLRLSYDDTNYVSFTTGSTGNLTIDTAGTAGNAVVIQDGGTATTSLYIGDSSVQSNNNNDSSIRLYGEQGGVVNYASIGHTGSNMTISTTGSLQVSSSTGGDLDLTSGTGLWIRDSGNTDYVDFSHNGTDFNIAGTNTTDINITGANLALQADNEYLRIGASDDFQIVHNGTNTLALNTTGNLIIGGDSTAAGSQIQFGDETGATAYGFFITGATDTGDFGVDTNTLYVDASANSVGIGDSSPVSMFTVGSGDLFQISSTGRIVAIDGVAHTIDDVSGDLTLTSNSTQVVITDHLLPSADNTYDLGSTTNSWRNGYFTGSLCFDDTDCVSNWGTAGLWTQALGALYPNNSTVDLLIGSTATTSAKFAFINVNSGTPVASIAGNIKLSGGARTIGGTAMNDLTIGDAQTGGIALAPAGSTSLFAAQGGNVGIGTTTPSTKLHLYSSAASSVYATIQTSTADQQVALQFLSGTGDWINYIPGSTSDLRWYSSGADRITFQTDGDVGIGDTTPLSLFTVGNGDLFQVDSSGNIVSVGGVAHSLANSGGNLVLTSNGELYLNDTRTGNIPLSLTDSALDPGLTQGLVDAINDLYGTVSSPGSGSSLWSIIAGAMVPKNVSLDLLVGGTSTASAKFGVLNMGSGTPVASIAGNIKLSGGIRSIGGTAMNNLTIGDAETGALTFAPAGSTAMTIAQGGNVGIGITAPSVQLHLYGAGTTQWIQTNAATGVTSNAGLGLLDSTGAGWIAYNDSNANSDAFSIGRMAGGAWQATALTINTSDNVGIGTIAPDARLDSLATSGEQLRLTYTDGSVYTGFTVNGSGNLTIDNSGTTTTIADSLIVTSQTRLGNIASDPTALGAGSLYYNTTANKVYYYNGSIWQEMGSGGSSNWTDTALGTIHPSNTTLDLLVGGTTTASATFRVNAQTGAVSVGSVALGAGHLVSDISGNLNINSTGSYVRVEPDLLIGGGDILGTSGETRITLSDSQDLTLINGKLDVDGYINGRRGATLSAYASTDQLLHLYSASASSLMYIDPNGVFYSDKGIAGGTAWIFDTTTANTYGDADLFAIRNNGVNVLQLDNSGNLSVTGNIYSDKGFGISMKNVGPTLSQYDVVVINTTISASDGVPRMSATDSAYAKLAFGVVQQSCTTNQTCKVVIQGKSLVNAADIVTRGQYLFSSTTLGKAIASGRQFDGLMGIATSDDSTAPYQVEMTFLHQPSVAKLQVADKNRMHNDYRLAAFMYDRADETTRYLTDENIRKGLFFDTFRDSVKTDTTELSVAIDNLKQRAGLAGGITMNATNTDTAGNTYLGAADANDTYYYDRAQTGALNVSQDSEPQTLVELGIDPNWYNGVTLDASPSADLSNNPPANLSTTYNGSLIKVSGTYAAGEEDGPIIITILSDNEATASANPTITFNWRTIYNTHVGSNILVNKGQAYTLDTGTSDVTVTFTDALYHNGDTFKIHSWLLEPTTANDRGSKRAFPDHANIIAGDSNVDIIDADTNKLWMRFLQGTDYLLGVDSTNDPSSVHMMNGKLLVGTNGAGATGMYRIDFANDQAMRYNATAGFHYLGKGISDRNTDPGNAYDSTFSKTAVAIANAAVNDVHTNVVPNQPAQEVTVRGWGYLTGSGADPQTETVSLGLKFNTPPTIQISPAGNRATSAGVPTGVGDCTTALATGQAFYVVTSPTTTGFSANANTIGNGTSGTNYYCYTWTATGTVSPQMFVADANDTAVSVTNLTNPITYDVSDVTSDDYNQVWLTSGGQLYATNETQAQLEKWNEVISATADETNDTPDKIWDDSSTNYPSISNAAVTLNASAPNSLAVTEKTSTIDNRSDTIYVSHNLGVAVIQDYNTNGSDGDGDTEADGSVKYFAKDVISEEMIGDTRLMLPFAGTSALSADTTLPSPDSDRSRGANAFTTDGAATVPTHTSGVRGKALSFDGGDYLCSGTTGTCAGDSDLNFTSEDFTISMWLNPTSSSNYNVPFKYGSGYQGNGYYTLLDANRMFCFFTNQTGAVQSTCTNNGAIKLNQWSYVAVVRQGATVRIYVNGIDRSNGGGVHINPETSTGPATLGSYDTAAGNPFVGSIDEFFITAEALSSNQVKRLYESGKRALDGSHSINDTKNNLDENGTGAGATDVVQAVGVQLTSPDKGYGPFLYTASNNTSNADDGYVNRVDLSSDTVTQWMQTTTDPALPDNDITSLGVSPSGLEIVGANGIGAMAPGQNAQDNNSSGTLYSDTITLPESINSAYLWLNSWVDSDCSTCSIAVWGSNDGGLNYVAGTLTTTDSNQSLPEKEYFFNFTNLGSSLKIKFVLTRDSSLDANIYIEKYGVAWFNNDDVAGSDSGTGGFFTMNGTSTANGSYIEVQHNQDTYDLITSGWMFDTASGTWKEVSTATESGVISTSGSVANGSYLEVTHNQNTNDVVANGWYLEGSEYRQTDSVAGNDEALLNTGDGSDGALTVASGATSTINDGTTFGLEALATDSGALQVNKDRIEVASTTGFSAGDEVLVMQMKGDGAGTYEYATVESITTNDYIDLTANLKHDYQQGGSSSDLTTSGQAIGTCTSASSAFDNDFGSLLTTCTGAGTTVGQDFGANTWKNIRTVWVKMYNSGGTNHSVKLQYSDDNSTWYDTDSSFNGLDYAQVFQFNVNDYGTHRYWRLYNNTANTWYPYEVQMFEEQNKAQVIEVPQYTNVTINDNAKLTAPDWDGSIGGVLTFRATGTVTINRGGEIDLKGKGYRALADLNGEGYNGVQLPGNISSENYAFGGGGGCDTAYSACNGGGGGGSHATIGSSYLSGNVNTWTYGTDTLDKIFFGGAGGSGDANVGGDGGGIAMVHASTLINNSSISSNGSMPAPLTNVGAGAGGSIYIRANTLTNTGIISAQGNDSSNMYYAVGNSGHGRIRIDAATYNGSKPYSGGSYYEGSVYPKFLITNPTINTTRLYNYSGVTQTMRLDVSTQGFRIVQVDSNTVRLYNYSGSTQNIRLDAITNTSSSGTGNNSCTGCISLAPLTADVDAYTGTNSIWVNKTSETGKLLKLQNDGVDRFSVGWDGHATLSGNLTPGSNDVFDLGADSLRWRDLYLGPDTLHIGTSTSDEYAISYNTTSNYLGFNVNGSGNAEIVFDSAGKVGIGTITPTSTLDVAGTARFSDNVLLTSGVNALGDFQSMAPNSGFEVNDDVATTYADAWTGGYGGTASVSVETTSPLQGSKSQNLVVGATGASNFAQFYSACIPLSAGTSYQLSARVKAVTNAATNGYYQRLLGYTTKANCENLVSPTSYDTHTSVAVATTVGTKIGTITVGSTITWGRIIFYYWEPSVATTIIIDDVKLTGGTGGAGGLYDRHRQNDTTNSVVNNQVVRKGWGWVNNAATDTPSYGITYEDVPILVAGTLGIAASTPSVLSDCVNNTSTGTLQIYGPTTTGFTVYNGSGSNYVCYTWLAIGTYSAGYGADLAEHYLTYDLSAKSGDLVAIDINHDVAVGKTNGNAPAIGVVSTNPGLLLGNEDGTTEGVNTSVTGEEVASGVAKSVPIALSGRVPVKVNLENGAIKKGDPLTTSSVAGVAKKAVGPANIIGFALEDWDGTTTLAEIGSEIDPSTATNSAELAATDPDLALLGQGIGKVMVFIAPQTYVPNNEMAEPIMSLDSLGEITLSSQNMVADVPPVASASSTLSVANAPLFQLLTRSGELIQSLGAFSDAVIGNLRAGLITAKRTQSAQVDVDFIQPLFGNDVTVQLGHQSATNSAQFIVRDANGIQLAAIDQSGISAASAVIDEMESRFITAADLLSTQNASVSGELVAESARIKELSALNASVSGTLFADRISGAIDSSNITDLEARVTDIVARERATAASSSPSALLASLQNSDTNWEELLASLLTDDSSDGDGETPAQPPITPSDLPLLALTDSAAGRTLTLTAQSLSFEINDTCLSSVVTPCDTFSIQPSGAGTLSFLADTMVISRDGGVRINTNVRVAGDVTTEKSLFAAALAPLPNNNLQINLAATNENGETTPSDLIVTGLNGAEVAAISASGSARFQKLIIAAGETTPNQGASLSATVANNATTGTAALTAGSTELTLAGAPVTDSSLIYLTPTSSTGNRVLYVLRKSADNPATAENEAAFTVAVDSATDQNITFNWWVIN